MGSNSSVQLKVGTILSYLQMLVSIIIGLLYTPIMIRLLGKSEYGLYNTVSSTIAMLSVLSLGFNSSYIRFYSKYKNKNDLENINRLNGLYFIIFSVIGVIALICGIVLLKNIQLVFGTGLTNAEYETARILMGILIINLSISFPMLVFSSIISAHEKYIALKLIGILKTVAGPLVTLPLLLKGYGSVAMVSVTVILSLVADAIYIFYVLAVLKCKFSFRRVENGITKELFAFTAFIALELIVDQINWNIDKVLLARFCGTTSVAVYSVGYSLYSYYQLCSTCVSGVFTPRIHKIVNSTLDNAELQKEKLTVLFVRVGRIQFLVLAFLASMVLFFGKSFILNIWAGNGYDESYYVALILIFAAIIPLMQNLGIEIQRAKNVHQFRSVLYVAMAIVNLVLSVKLCQMYGAVGSAIGTAISLVLANGIIMNVFYHKKCSLDIGCFWKNIVMMFLGLSPAFVFGYILSNFADAKGIFTFLLCCFLYCVIFILTAWKLSMNEVEKELIKKPLKKFLRIRGK